MFARAGWADGNDRAVGLHRHRPDGRRAACRSTARTGAGRTIPSESPVSSTTSAAFTGRISTPAAWASSSATDNCRIPGSRNLRDLLQLRAFTRHAPQLRLSIHRQPRLQHRPRPGEHVRWTLPCPVLAPAAICRRVDRVIHDRPVVQSLCYRKAKAFETSDRRMAGAADGGGISLGYGAELFGARQ